MTIVTIAAAADPAMIIISVPFVSGDVRDGAEETEKRHFDTQCKVLRKHTSNMVIAIISDSCTLQK